MVEPPLPISNREVKHHLADKKATRNDEHKRRLSQPKKRKPVKIKAMHNANSTIFCAPKCGGILQSSGFLDLKSLMALSETCKANAFDEQSLIQLIENEITRFHGVHSMEEAIVFWKTVLGERPWFKQWFKRDENGISLSNEFIKTIQIAETVRYEVMFVKVLRVVATTDSERLRIVNEQLTLGMTLLHHAAESGNRETINTILILYSESEELLQVVLRKDLFGRTVLSCAARSGNCESFEAILSLIPESERFQALTMQDRNGMTLLHRSVIWNKPKFIRYLISLYSKPQLLQALNIRDRNGKTVLHCAVSFHRDESLECINTSLALYSESERLEAVSLRDISGQTALHSAALSGNIESLKTILSLCPETERLQTLDLRDHSGKTVLYCAAEAGNVECIKHVLSRYPESERMQALNTKDEEGDTVLDRMPIHAHDLVMKWLSKPSEMQNEDEGFELFEM